MHSLETLKMKKIYIKPLYFRELVVIILFENSAGIINYSKYIWRLCDIISCIFVGFMTLFHAYLNVSWNQSMHILKALWYHSGYIWRLYDIIPCIFKQFMMSFHVNLFVPCNYYPTHIICQTIAANNACNGQLVGVRQLKTTCLISEGKVGQPTSNMSDKWRKSGATHKQHVL